MAKTATANHQIENFLNHYGTEAQCASHLRSTKWSDGLFCPHCASKQKVYKIEDGTRYKCAECKTKFSLKVGTIFHNSKLPLRTWYQAIYLYSLKENVSSRQLAADLGITQKSALRVLQRIREISGNDGKTAIQVAAIGSGNHDYFVGKSNPEPAKSSSEQQPTKGEAG